jgi:hypothetical protein
VAYRKDKPEIQFLVIPGFGKIEYHFLVEGEVTICCKSRHGGKLKETVSFE